MRTSFLTALFSTLAAALLLPSSIPAQTTTRVSVDSSGTEGNGPSTGSSTSSNGRYVAFESTATNLVASDTNAVSDIFSHDRQTGATVRVSVDSSGTQGNGASTGASISASGRFVAFHSLATNLVASDTNGYMDIFVHDLLNSTTTRVSVSSAGAQATNFSANPSLSADGDCVVFHSIAGNLVASDSNGTQDIFVHVVSTGVTTRVSVDSSGAQTTSISGDPTISADGNCIAFMSYDSSLVTGDTNGVEDIFVHDRTTAVTSRVSVDSSGGEANGASGKGAISGDGQSVSFQSSATNLVASDSNGTQDIFVHDRSTAATTRVSVDSSGTQGNGTSSQPSLSVDGRYVVFNSTATNLIASDTNAVKDSFLHDRLSGATSRVSVDSSGTEANGLSLSAMNSYYGSEISFSSDATNLVASDSNGVQDVFVFDLGTYPSLTLSGSCPGVVNITINNATPNQQVALLYGPAGAFTKPGSPCQGILLGINPPTLAATPYADSSGTLVYAFNVPSFVCGKTIQAVDITTCLVTNTAVL